MASTEDHGRTLVIVGWAGDPVSGAFVRTGTVDDLADLLRAVRLSDDGDVTELYALNSLGELKPIALPETKVDAYDERGYSVATVTVRFPDGGRDSACYLVDGNA